MKRVYQYWNISTQLYLVIPSYIQYIYHPILDNSSSKIMPHPKPKLYHQKGNTCQTTSNPSYHPHCLREYEYIPKSQTPKNYSYILKTPLNPLWYTLKISMRQLENSIKTSSVHPRKLLTHPWSILKNSLTQTFTKKIN